MKNLIWLILILFPLFGFAMGNPFRPSYHLTPHAVGVNHQDCSEKYQSGSHSQLLGKTYDPTCIYILKSTPVDIDPNCNYDDYRQTENYKNEVVRETTRGRYLSINKATATGLKFGLVDVEAFQKHFGSAYYNSTGQMEFELLLGKYCQKAVPKTPQSAFATHVDVPAQVISLWSEDYIKSRWNQHIKYLTQKFPDTDFITIIELNLKGAQIWDKLLTCANGDAELARNQYFTTQFSCDRGPELKNEIKGYIQSVKMFFSTSFMKPVEIKIKTEFDLLMAVTKKDTVVKSEYEPFPTFHPLFNQAIQQMLVDIYPVGSHDKVSLDFINNKLGLSSDRQSTTLLQVIAQINEFMPDGLPMYGLWPSASTTVHARIQNTRLQMFKLLSSNIKIENFDGIAFGAFRKLPQFYSDNKAKITDQIRELNRRYGL